MRNSYTSNIAFFVKCVFTFFLLSFFLLVSSLTFALSLENNIDYNVESFECYLEFDDDFGSRIFEQNFSDFSVSIWRVSVAENANIEGVLVNAAKGAGLTLKTANQAYKGTTRLGHALSKHSGRNPQIWGKIKGSPSTWHNQGLKHYNDIMNAPGKFNQVTNPNGIKFLEKWLPDGRGMRLNMDRTFKGFID